MREAGWRRGKDRRQARNRKQGRKKTIKNQKVKMQKKRDGQEAG